MRAPNKVVMPGHPHHHPDYPRSKCVPEYLHAAGHGGGDSSALRTPHAAPAALAARPGGRDGSRCSGGAPCCGAQLLATHACTRAAHLAALAGDCWTSTGAVLPCCFLEPWLVCYGKCSGDSIQPALLAAPDMAQGLACGFSKSCQGLASCSSGCSCDCAACCLHARHHQLASMPLDSVRDWAARPMHAGSS